MTVTLFVTITMDPSLVIVIMVSLKTKPLVHVKISMSAIQTQITMIATITAFVKIQLVHINVSVMLDIQETDRNVLTSMNVIPMMTTVLCKQLVQILSVHMIVHVILVLRAVTVQVEHVMILTNVQKVVINVMK